MVLKLSDLLRASLNKIDHAEIPLQQELDLLECYLNIEQTRFRDRLTIEKEIAADALPCSVPTMILQPLVENAVRHGIGKHKQADSICVIACRENGRMRLEVRNRIGSVENGGPAPTRGIGLSNTQARLEQLYSTDYSFEITDCEGGGVVVKLSFPARDNGAGALPSKSQQP